MNRDEKAVVIEKIASSVKAADAVFAVDYRGIDVAQVAELRTKLRGADATFQVVKNTLTNRALDATDSAGLKDFLEGPTAFTYVNGDVAAAAKILSQFAKETELLAYKGGQMGDHIIESSEFGQLATLPSRDLLNARLAGMVAHPLVGVVRSLGGLIGGLAQQLGQIAEQGLVTGTAAPAEAKPEVAEAAPDAGATTASEATPDAEAETEAAAEAEAPADEAPTEEASDDDPSEETPAEETSDEAPAESDE